MPDSHVTISCCQTTTNKRDSAKFSCTMTLYDSTFHNVLMQNILKANI